MGGKVRDADLKLAKQDAPLAGVWRGRRRETVIEAAAKVLLAKLDHRDHPTRPAETLRSKACGGRKEKKK